MAFSEQMAERIRLGLVRKKIIDEKRMFGSIGTDDPLNGWIQRTVKFVEMPAAKRKENRETFSLDCRRPDLPRGGRRADEPR